MSFYTCEECNQSYGFTEKEPYTINKFDNFYFCSIECLQKWLGRLK